jgi:CheY-like chemotaxis protein
VKKRASGTGLTLTVRPRCWDDRTFTSPSATTQFDRACENAERSRLRAISFSDIGTEMDKVTVERRFEPILTTKEAGKGLGQGLSQVYGFVRQPNGHIRIYSEVGDGTTIKIYLPLLIGSCGEAAEKPSKSPATVQRSGNIILVVEDEPDLRAHTIEALGDLGCRVLEASDDREALEVVKKHSEIKLFADVALRGGMNGRAIADEVMRLRLGLPVLFTTGYTSNAIAHRSRLDPRVRLIGKLFIYAELTAKGKRMLDGN